MPRRPRFDLQGIPLHVIQRGVDRRPVFFCDDDCAFYLDWLGHYAHERSICLHSYCLMTNHIHLLLTASTGGALGKLMQDMGRRYVQFINHTYRRSGGLWEGRYKTCYIQAERYLLSCQRYIDLNPVRAGMAAAPGEYRWSSYRSNALGLATTLLTPTHEYLALHKDANATQQGVVVGERPFIEEIEQRIGCVVRPTPRGLPKCTG